MIGDHQPIQRARQPNRLSGGGHHFLATREPVGIARRQAVTEQTRIHRNRGMEVGIAPQWTDGFSTSIGYRYLAVDYSNNGFLYDVVLQGPNFALIWRF